MNQEDQIEFFRKKNNQKSFKIEAWFQQDKSFIPKPPSAFVVVTDDQATLYVLGPSIAMWVPIKPN